MSNADSEIKWELQKERNTTHSVLSNSMCLYNYLPIEHREVICDFVQYFYDGKNIYAHKDIDNRDVLMILTAANAALVGAAQNVNYFSCVKWIYFCSDDLAVDGDAFLTSTVRLNAERCVDESENIRPGRNLIVHEFSHILDNLLGISGSTAGLRKGYDQYLGDIENGDSTPIEDCFTPMDIVDRAITHSEHTVLHSEVEFFAAASEAFFTNASELSLYHSELYTDLVAIYGLELANLNWLDLKKG